MNNARHQKYALVYITVCARLCFRLYCHYYHWLHLRLKAFFSTEFCSKGVEDDYLAVLTFTCVVRSLLLSAISFNGFVWPRHNI